MFVYGIVRYAPVFTITIDNHNGRDSRERYRTTAEVFAIISC